jgi:hypothetical protein
MIWRPTSGKNLLIQPEVFFLAGPVLSDLNPDQGKHRGTVKPGIQIIDTASLTTANAPVRLRSLGIAKVSIA